MLFTDRVASTLDRALDGVALRQRVVSQNISNAMTPGYRAERVEFEGALSAAVAAGDPASVKPTVVAAGGVADANGNDVRLEDEATELMRSGLQYEALVQAVNYRHNVWHTALAR